jgi:FtsH-binding integral membrane protein
MALAQARRPIEGAVATLGVSDRVAFLKRTYQHLGIALVMWVALTAGIFRYASGFSASFSQWALQGRWTWLLVMFGFMGVKSVARQLSMSDTSKNAQYFALFLSPLAEAVILQPLLWVLFARFSGTETSPYSVLGEAALITGTIFVGLTLTVMWTKKDFSFLGGFLQVGFWAALGVIMASLMFGFSLGMVFCGAMVLLVAGYILYETSLVMAYFPPNKHVAAALMLYSSLATLFWYILQMVMSSRRN